MLTETASSPTLAVAMMAFVTSAAICSFCCSDLPDASFTMTCGIGSSSYSWSFWLAALLEYGARNGGGREGVRPAAVIGKMTDGLRCFGLRQAVIQRPGEMAGELRELTRRDQCADRHE